ncbi:MAG: hypothetical protein ACOYU5_06150 [Stygiobacter sp.]|jgi:hypothetical protein
MKFTFYLFFFSLIILIQSCTNFVKTEKQNVTSVIIMPIMPRENYPFKFDQDRKILVWNFQSRGFNVIEDEKVWNEIINTDLDLTKLQNADIVKISKLIKVDLIISSNGEKVYDCNKNSFIIDNNSYQPTQDLALYLKSRGY